jgi:hypothetical protein
MVRLYVINADNIAVNTIRKWNRQPVLTCVDDQGRRISVVVNNRFNFKAYLVLTPETAARIGDFDQNDINEMLDRINGLFHQRFKTVVSMKLIKRKPLIGFTNDRDDTLLQLNLANLSKFWKLKKKLNELDNIFLPDLEVGELVDHLQINNQLLYDRDIKMFNWIDVKLPHQKKFLNKSDFYELRGTGFVRNGCADEGSRMVVVSPSDITSVPEETAPLPPKLNVCYLGVHAKSMTATNRNLFAADPEFDGDVLTLLACKIKKGFDNEESKDDDGRGVDVMLQLDDQGEAGLLTRFGTLLQDNSIDVLVPSESWMVPYIVARIEKLDMDTVLTSVNGNSSRRAFMAGDDGVRRLIDTAHPGRVRLDVVNILKKFMTVRFFFYVCVLCLIVCFFL